MKTSFSCLIILVVAIVHIINGSFTVTVSAAAVAPDFDNCAIIDITRTFKNDMLAFSITSRAGLIVNETVWGPNFMTGNISIGTHLGTHVDAPPHIFPELMNKESVDNLNLATLMGPVLVVKTPDGVNITDKVIDSLQIPRGVERVIFKTPNTDRKLMDQPMFAKDYTAFTREGAQRLVDQTDVKFVGIDYMSVAIFDQIVDVHKSFLRDPRGIIPVENLNLDEVEPGEYIVYCLPARILAEASPTRCILVK